MLNMDKVIARYRELLPARFEDLSTDFAVGVYTRDGKYRVIDSGPLPEAVVASAAIPLVFEHVDVPGVGQCMDGGKHDRVGLTGWEQRERAPWQGSAFLCTACANATCRALLWRQLHVGIPHYVARCPDA